MVIFDNHKLEATVSDFKQIEIYLTNFEQEYFFS